MRHLSIVNCGALEPEAAWVELEQMRLRGMSLVDATSFVLMRAHRIGRAFTFDYHFGAAGFMTAG